jgi:ParB family chromosome partitioning protein
VLRVAAFVMAESLQQGTHLIDTLGKTLGVDMRNWWQGDDAFYDLLRDKAAINAMLREIAGKRVAEGNVTEPVKTQKKIIRNFAEGVNGRTKKEGWLPRYMKFPQGRYLKRA